jgi:hypothetical protein
LIANAYRPAADSLSACSRAYSSEVVSTHLRSSRNAASPSGERESGTTELSSGDPTSCKACCHLKSGLKWVWILKRLIIWNFKYFGVHLPLESSDDACICPPGRDETKGLDPFTGSFFSTHNATDQYLGEIPVDGWISTEKGVTIKHSDGMGWVPKI